MSWLLGPYSEPRTYRIVVYLMVGLGMGILDFTLLVTGFSLGLGLLVTIIGIPVLIGTFLVARGLAIMEQRLAVGLLDAPMPHRRPAPAEGRGIGWQHLRALVRSQRTWSETAFLMLRLPLGILDFTFVVTVIALALGGFGWLIAVAAGAECTIGSWRIDTVPEALVYLPVSVLFVLVGPRLVIGWGGVSARVATRFLGRIGADEMKREVTDVLVHRKEADGFAILEELGLRMGQGSFLSPSRVEAALLALESSGRVTVDRTGARATYRLA
jgi:hypothetical protein